MMKRQYRIIRVPGIYGTHRYDIQDRVWWWFFTWSTITTESFHSKRAAEDAIKQHKAGTLFKSDVVGYY